MEFTGLMRKYPVIRALTGQERERQLMQKVRLDVEPAYQLSVIRMNSTYVELVDKFFEWKGLVTIFFAFAAGMIMFFETGALYRELTRAGAGLGDFLYVSIEFTLVASLLAFLVWMLLKDAFTYTHYPIRLNRKTRMVHVFRLNGTVLSVPWDEVFFCIGSLPQYNWEIQGHVLEKDRNTVKETFAFPMIIGSRKEKSLLKNYWEFVRRYMEDENLAEIHAHACYVLPIAEKRESFIHGWHRTHSMVAAAPFPLQILIFALYVVIYPGRWIAMRTSNIPVWPKEIEDTCQVEPGDPYMRDARDNPEDLR